MEKSIETGGSTWPATRGNRTSSDDIWGTAVNSSAMLRFISTALASGPRFGSNHRNFRKWRGTRTWHGRHWLACWPFGRVWCEVWNQSDSDGTHFQFKATWIRHCGHRKGQECDFHWCRDGLDGHFQGSGRTDSLEIGALFRHHVKPNWNRGFRTHKSKHPCVHQWEY